MKKASEVFKKIRFAKLDPKHENGHSGGSTDDEQHYTVGEKEFNQQVAHVKKRAMQEETLDEVSSDLVKKARDAAFTKGKEDQGHRFVRKAYEKGQKESEAMAKKINEVSNEMLQRYKEKAGKEIDNPATPSAKKLKRGVGHLKATSKQMTSGKPMPESVELEEQNYEMEKKEMAQTQLHFIKYAAEEILEYIDMGGEIEEWYQNKLSKVHSDIESLHSYVEGEKRRTEMVKEAQTAQKTEPVKKKDAADDFVKFIAAKRSMGKPVSRKTSQLATTYSLMKKEEVDFNVKVTHQTDAGEVSHKIYKVAKAQDHRHAQNIALKKHTAALDKAGTKFKNATATVVREENELQEGENKQVKGGDPCWKGYEMVGKKMKGGKEVPNCVPVKEAAEKPPFEGGKEPSKKAVAGKHGAGYSTARHLARMALKKQQEKMQPLKKVNESKKAEIVKRIAKKNVSDDKFQKDPELDSKIQKVNDVDPFINK